MPIRTGATLMSHLRRPITIVLLVALTAIVACSPGVGGLAVPTASPTQSPPTAQSSLDPTASPVETAPPATTASESPPAAPTEASSAPSPTADPATVLAADGIEPYDIGALLSELQSEGRVTDPEPSLHCDDSWQSAEATGRHAGVLHLTFHLGRLTDVATDSPEFVTPSGARVGMSLTELQTIYGDRGRVLTGINGNQALSVRVPATDLGIVFYLDEANTQVVSMSAGEVERLEEMVIAGEGC
jgi:hypothetical protein